MYDIYYHDERFDNQIISSESKVTAFRYYLFDHHSNNSIIAYRGIGEESYKDFQTNCENGLIKISKLFENNFYCLNF